MNKRVKTKLDKLSAWRAIPTFSMVIEHEKRRWMPFRNALDKKDRKNFDKMLDIPRWYISARSNSVESVTLIL